MQDLFTDPSHIYDAMHHEKYTEFHLLRSSIYNNLKDTHEKLM